MKKALFLLLSCFLFNCSSGVESAPVSLPVPFSGALTLEQVVMETGCPLTYGQRDGHAWGVEWELFDSFGSVGSLIVNLEGVTDSETIDNTDSFQEKVTLQFDDGSFITADSVQVFASPVELTLDSIVCSDAPPLEFGDTIETFGGMGFGEVTATDEALRNLMGGTLNYRFVHQARVHADGTHSLFISNFCSWSVSPL